MSLAVGSKVNFGGCDSKLDQTSLAVLIWLCTSAVAQDQVAEVG